MARLAIPHQGYRRAAVRGAKAFLHLVMDLLVLRLTEHCADDRPFGDPSQLGYCIDERDGAFSYDILAEIAADDGVLLTAQFRDQPSPHRGSIHHHVDVERAVNDAGIGKLAPAPAGQRVFRNGDDLVCQYRCHQAGATGIRIPAVMPDHPLLGQPCCQGPAGVAPPVIGVDDVDIQLSQQPCATECAGYGAQGAADAEAFPDREGFVERSGVIVGTSDFSGASISGMTFRIPGQPPLVLLNRNHPADRLRFTLAHELGHLVMHRFPTIEMEDEANEFASSLLLPEREMREAFSGRRITLELLAALKPEWRVAMQALLMRAKALGFLTDNQNRYLWQQISSRGWRLREPPELDFEPEKPSVLDSMIKAHLDDLGFTLSDLTNFVPMHEDEFQRLYNLDDGSTSKPRLRLVV